MSSVLPPCNNVEKREDKPTQEKKTTSRASLCSREKSIFVSNIKYTLLNIIEARTPPVTGSGIL
jgi:hypothetical protein